MDLHSLRLRFRRRFRTRKRQVARLSLEAEEQIEERFFKRLNRLTRVRRFVVIWVLLVTALLAGVLVQLQALSGYYQTLQYVNGGTYSEGMVGAFTNGNPIYATGTADVAVSRLVFASLLKYDANGTLQNDLAETWSSNARGTDYTFKLKPNLTWHDGQPLTAQDVVYTYQLIQNPDARSPLAGGFQNIKIVANDNRTVTFTLPGALSSFPYSLTTGIVPQHILSVVPTANLRADRFNSSGLVGSGPFRLSALQVTGDTPSSRQEQVALVPFDNYYGGRPKLDQFIIRAFRDRQQLISSYQQGDLTAITGLSAVPSELTNKPNQQVVSMTTSAANMVFFKTNNGVLADKAVRQALVAGANPAAIMNDLNFDTPLVNQPFLAGQVSNDPALGQQTNSAEKANQILDAAGWQRQANGIRAKAGKPLQFNLTAQDTPEDRIVLEDLAKQWQAIGAKMNPDLRDANGLQDVVTYHNYDALLYGLTIGPDPDVFAYWHSSQADVRSANRLNFSEYKSKTADAALEAGRARDDAELRAVKYQPFLRAWLDDAPALGLYQPRYLYISNQKVEGLAPHLLVNPADRYSNVQNWMVRQARVTN